MAAPPTAPSTSISIKRAESESDYWSVADVHCRAFYPNDKMLLGMLLRVDRVSALATGEDLVQKNAGNFACLTAEVPPGTLTATPPAYPLGALHPVRLATAMLPSEVREGLGVQGKNTDVVGALVVDDLCEHLPTKKTEFLGRVQYHKRKGVAYLSNLCVCEAARRRGVARSLVTEAEERARAWGCRSAALHVEPSNAAAIALYEALGYRQLPIFTERDWTPMGTRELVLMMKTLRRTR